MAKSKNNKTCLTTVAVTPDIHMLIKREAARRDLPNHEIIRKAMLSYTKKAQATDARSGHQDEIRDDDQSHMAELISKLVKRDDTAIAFIRQSERNLLQPIFKKVSECYNLLTAINDMLNNI